MTFDEKNIIYSKIEEIKKICYNCINVENNLFSIENFIQYIKDSLLYNKVCFLGYYVNKFNIFIIKIVCDSFASYIRLLIAKNRIGKEISSWTSFLKGLDFFENMTKRDIIEYFLNSNINDCINGNERTRYLLACSTMLDDSLQTEREVLRILDFTGSKYVVIPIFKCTTSLFEKILSKYNIKAIHIASHGKPKKIKFLDADLGHRGFINIFKRTHTTLDFLFLNACDSETLRCDLKSLCQLITYDGTLHLPTPTDFSESFYSYFLLKNYTLKTSFNYSKNEIFNTSNYIFK